MAFVLLIAIASPPAANRAAAIRGKIAAFHLTYAHVQFLSITVEIHAYGKEMQTKQEALRQDALCLTYLLFLGWIRRAAITPHANVLVLSMRHLLSVTFSMATTTSLVGN